MKGNEQILLLILSLHPLFGTLKSWNSDHLIGSKVAVLLVAGSGKLDSKASRTKTRLTSKDRKKTFTRAVLDGCSKEIENIQRKNRNPASVALIFGFITTRLHHEHFFSGKLFQENYS